MIVIVANALPDAVRGKLKLWFVEPKANVFVSGVKDHLADRVVELVLKYTPLDSGLIVFQSLPQAPWYRIHIHGTPSRWLESVTGLQVFAEKCVPAASEPDH